MFLRLVVLTQLDGSQHSPANKAAIMVAAHRVVVGETLKLFIPWPFLHMHTDGLSKLPPIRLKSEADSERQRAASDEHSGGSFPIKSASSSQLNANVTSTIPSPHHDSASPPVPSLDCVYSEGDHTSLGLTTAHEELQSQPAAAVSQPYSCPDSPTKTTLISGDVLLPLIIFSVVKANPPHLVSHLLYTQRFRNQSVGGEESYCLMNLMAVAEFLENVDLAALGLAENENRVLRFVHKVQVHVSGMHSHK
jgi:Vacuolar sorting protein 9 (VPS9) domain